MAQQQTDTDGPPNRVDKAAAATNDEGEDVKDGGMHSILAEIGLSGFSGNEQRPLKYKYSKDQLITLSKTPGAKRRPNFLNPAYFNENGVWDPEKWAVSERCDGGVVHQEAPRGKRERPADLEREAVSGGAVGAAGVGAGGGGGKRRISADPKERLLEEQDGIVLSPQRRSFGTGCHVPQQQQQQQPPPQLAVGRRSESPGDLRVGVNDRDAHRDQGRRIGSGRFAPRERGERERDREREFGYRGAIDRNNDRNNDRRDRDRDDRDVRDTRVSFREGPRKDSDRRGGRDKGFRRIHEEVEPEWFSGGPTSQSDTIELRGFDEPTPEDKPSASEKERPLPSSVDAAASDRGKRERRQSWRRQKTPSIEETGEKVTASVTTTTTNNNNNATISIAQSVPPAKKAGSRPHSSASGSMADVETGATENHDRSCTQQHQQRQQQHRQEKDSGGDSNSCDFDFNDLFKLDTLSELFPLSNGPSPETVSGTAGLTGSRFGQFFQHPRQSSPVANHSSDNSRRSSFQDELMAPIVGHTANDVRASRRSPSPPNSSAAFFQPIDHSGHRRTLQSDASQPPRSLLEMLQSGKEAHGAHSFLKNNLKNGPLQELAMSGKVHSVQELEEGLKSLVLGQQQQQGQWTQLQQIRRVSTDGASDQRRGTPAATTTVAATAAKEMNAFDKLLCQISDGKITATTTTAAAATPCAVAVDSGKIRSEEKCSLENANRMSGQARSSAHLMSILKNAPTERDILAGLVKGNSIGQGVPGGGQQQQQQSSEVLSLLVPSTRSQQQPQHQMNAAIQQQQRQQGDALTKMLAASTAGQGGGHFSSSNANNAASSSSSDVMANFFNDATLQQLGMIRPQATLQQQQPQPSRKQQQPAPSGPHPADPIQQKQREILAAILKQQKQQQQHVGQPRVQQVASPPPQQQQLRRGQSPPADSRGSPRGTQSPLCSNDVVMQQVMLQQQMSRVPSPLVFGQTPPVISHAPSPIHPAQMGQALGAINSVNSNTLLVQTPHVMQRVPSPLELQVHTQQILQNALIKKKLEEQKEKYRKRQELQGSRSPNPTPSGAAKFGGDVLLAKPSPSPNVNQMLSNIPTSVMRRMQADKDLQAKANLSMQHQQQQQMIANKLACNNEAKVFANQSQLLQSFGSEANDKMLQQAGLGRMVQGQGQFMNGQMHARQPLHVNAAGAPNHMSNQMQGRRIVKSNVGMPNQLQQRMGLQQQQQQQIMGNQQMKQQQQSSFMAPTNSMSVNKQILMQHQQQQQRQLNISPMSAAAAASLGQHPGMGGMRAGNAGSQMHSVVNPAAVVGVPPPNNLFLRNMAHPAAASSGAGALSQLNRMAAMDPRLLQAPNHHLHHLAVQQLQLQIQQMGGVGVGGGGGGNTSPRGINAVNPNGGLSHNPSSPLHVKDVHYAGGGVPIMGNGGGVAFPKGGGGGLQQSAGRHSPPQAGLERWFGDFQGHLPPVPTGRAHYVEEVEQRQQQHVHDAGSGAATMRSS